MRCYCCGKVIRGTSDTGWHKSCIKKFFGTTTLPQIDISEENLQRIAIDRTNKGFTIPGVQKKMSLHLSQEDEPRLTLANYPAGYILKPQSDEYAHLPELEHLVMSMARLTGIQTVPFALLEANQQLAYITRRVDRSFPDGEKLAMEDFCQLDGKLTINKYRGSYERCAKIIQRYSENPGLDLSELFLRLVFSFATGNSDMHLKNFSLIETEINSQKYTLSPAYDLLPVNVVLPADLDQMALTLNDKTRNLHRNDFLKFAAACDIPKVAASRMIDLVVSKEDDYVTLCQETELPDDLKDDFIALIHNRARCLQANIQ